MVPFTQMSIDLPLYLELAGISINALIGVLDNCSHAKESMTTPATMFVTKEQVMTAEACV